MTKKDANIKKLGSTFIYLRKFITTSVICDLFIKVGSIIKSTSGTSERTEKDKIPISITSNMQINAKFKGEIKIKFLM